MEAEQCLILSVNTKNTSETQYKMVKLHVRRSHYFKANNEPAFSADLFQGHGYLAVACFLFVVHFLFACLRCRLVLTKEQRSFRKQMRHRKGKEGSKKHHKIQICFSLIFSLVLICLHLTDHQWSL